MVNTPIDLDYLHTNPQRTVSNPLEHVVRRIKIAITGLSVMILCFFSVALIVCGSSVLEANKTAEFLAFVVPTSWVAFTNCYFLIKLGS